MDLENRIVDLFGLVTDAMDGSAGASWIVERPIIVVTPLEEDDVAGLDKGQRLRPLVFHDVGPAAASANGAVIDVDLAGIEEIDQRLTPTPLTIQPRRRDRCAPLSRRPGRAWEVRVGRRLEPIFA